MLRFRTAWSDFFEGNPSTPLTPKEYKERQTISGTNVYISNCLFNQCTHSSAGAALYSDSVTYLLIESTSFFSCKTSSSNGCGAIRFTNGDCVLHKVCGNDCCSTNTGSWYQFAEINAKSSTSSKNYINYSSFARCVNDHASSGAIFYVRYGKICCTSNNISMNKIGYRPGFSSDPLTDSKVVTCSFLYSSFVDNIATTCTCIYYNNANAKSEIKYCNILRNTQANLNSEGTISLYGNLTIENSCFIENNANYIFYSSSSHYKYTLSNCTLDKTITNTGNLIIQSTVARSFILALNHMSTRNCHSEYDSAGILIPITPHSPPSMKLICHCSCKMFFNQPRLRDVISLICVFISNFIHPYPSGGH
jgi:hypothetical protein